MKRISFLLAAVVVGTAPAVVAQDAATEERLNKLSGQIEDLKAGQDSLRKQIDALMKEIESVREQASKPSANYAAQEDLKTLEKAVKEVDQKRIEDAEKIQTQLLNLRKGLLSTPPNQNQKKSAPMAANDAPVSDKPEKGFEYTIQKGDTLSVIVKAYRDKNIKVSTEEILKANPDLKPEKMKVGQKIFIPAPKT
jgi:outer membrane murein-binding lipoprotein Lpp